MGKIFYLPAKDCLFYRLGFCLYEEILNPGYNQKLQCKILVKWEEEYDNLLDKAEVFGLSLQTVEKIWSSKSVIRYSEAKECLFFKEDTDNFCYYLYGYTCLRNLPECKGKCSYYTFKDEEDKN